MKKYLLAATAFFLSLVSEAQWLQQNANFVNDTLGFYEMSLPDRNTAWAVCYDGKAGLLSTRPVLSFTRTTDGGNNWTPGQMGNDRTLRFSNISAIDGQEAWVAMHKIGPIPNNYYGSVGKGGGIYHTTDAGLTWEHTNPGELFNNNSVPRFVHFKDKNHGVAMGDPNGGYFEIYITNNKGKKWKRVPQQNLPAPLPKEVGWISGHAVVGNTIWFGTDSGRMYKSVDFGQSWTVHTVNSQLGAYVHEIAFLDDGPTGVAHLRNTTRTFVFSTTDGGVTWTNYFQPPNWKNSRMTAVPGTDAFVSTAVHGNPLFRGSAVSYDAGATWTEIEKDASKAVCRFFDASTGYAGGFFVTGPPFRGGIFKSQIVFQQSAVSTNLRQPLLKMPLEDLNNMAESIYPSPAADVLHISLNDAFAKTTSTIQVLTTDGKTVLTARSNVTKLVKVNVSSLVPGMYMIRITGNGKTTNQLITIAR